MMSTGQIFTLGYGGRKIEQVTTLLVEARISFLLDVRSKPYSRFRPEFGRERLERRLKWNGIRYVFMGDTLGGLPDDQACYTDGHVDYKKCEVHPVYLRGIQRLRSAFEQGLRVALMCSEGKPWECHRAKLIGTTLDGLGLEVRHFLPDGSTLGQRAVINKLTGGQRELFGAALRSRRAYR